MDDNNKQGDKYTQNHKHVSQNRHSIQCKYNDRYKRKVATTTDHSKTNKT